MTNDSVYRLIFFICLIVTNKITAQQESYISLEWPAAYSWAHHNYMRPLTGRSVYGIQINKNFALKNPGNEWLRAYHYPDRTLSFIYQNLNHKNLGSIYAVFFHYGFPLNQPHSPVQFYFRFGEGLAYNTRPYDKIRNPGNIIFGSHLLYAFYFSVKARKTIQKRKWALELAASLYHYSNGSFKTPNSGLNLPAVSLSVIRFKSQKRVNLEKKTNFVSNFKPHNYPSIFGRFTFTEPDVPGIGRYPVYTFGMEYVWRRSFKHLYFLGTEIMLSRSLKRYLEYEEAAYGKYNGNIPSHVRSALTMGHRFYLGPVLFDTGIGIYYFNPSKKEAPWYVRAGLHYQVTGKWYLSATVKTHFFMAEEVDFGIHYRFNW